MPAVNRLYDKNSKGAPILLVPQSSVFANNLPVSVDGSFVKPHGLRRHRKPFTANGSSSVFVEGKPVNDRFDLDTCGHPRIGGSPDVFTHG